MDDKQVAAKLNKLKRSLPRTRPRRKVLAWWTSTRRKLVGKLLLFLFALSVVATLVPPFYWPVSAPTSSGFFLRLKPDSAVWAFEIHHGIDLAAPRGTTVHAAALGLVSAAGTTPELGHYVRVSHLWGTSTLYGHLDRIDVAPGEFVVPGFKGLGKVGSTGRSTGPHLHFGVFFLGIAMPPEPFLVFHSLRKALLRF